MMRVLLIVALIAVLGRAQYGLVGTGTTETDPKVTKVVKETPPATTCKGKAVEACAKKCKPHCNNGVGNGADCRPGRARFSNDDHGGLQGAPGSRGGGAGGTRYQTANKGDNTVVNDELTFNGDADGVFKKTKCHDDCEDAAFAICDKAEEAETIKEEIKEVKAEERAVEAQAHGECKLPAKGEAEACKKRSYDFCGPQVTSAFTTCREVFTKFCVNPVPVADQESCLRQRCDSLPGDKWHTAAEKAKACRGGGGRGGCSVQCQEQICVKVVATEAPKTEAPKKAEEPKPAEEPKKVEEPKKEEPKKEEPKKEEPKTEEPKKVEEPKKEEPKAVPVPPPAPEVLPVPKPEAPVQKPAKKNGSCRDFVELTAYALNLQCRLISLIQAVEGDNTPRGIQALVTADVVNLPVAEVVKVQQAQEKKEEKQAVAAKAKSKSKKAAPQTVAQKVESAKKERKALAYAAVTKVQQKANSVVAKKAASAGGNDRARSRSRYGSRSANKGRSRSNGHRGGYGGRGRSRTRSVGRRAGGGGGYGGRGRTVGRSVRRSVGGGGGGYGGRGRTVGGGGAIRRSVGGGGGGYGGRGRTVGGGGGGAIRRSIGGGGGGGGYGGRARSIGGGGRSVGGGRRGGGYGGF